MSDEVLTQADTVVALQKQQADLTAAINQSQLEKENMDKDRAESEKKKDIAQKDLEAKLKEVAEIEERKKNLIAETDKVQEKRNIAMAEATGVDVVIAQKKGELKELTDKYERLSSSLQTDYEKDSNEIKDSIESLKLEISQLTIKRDRAQSDVNQLNSSIRILLARKESLDSSIIELEEKINLKTQELATIDRRILENTETNSTLIRERDQIIEDTNNRKIDLEKVIADTETAKQQQVLVDGQLDDKRKRLSLLDKKEEYLNGQEEYIRKLYERVGEVYQEFSAQ